MHSVRGRPQVRAGTDRTGAEPGRLPGHRQVAASHGGGPGPRIAVGRAAEQLTIRAVADHGVHGPRGGRHRLDVPAQGDYAPVRAAVMSGPQLRAVVLIVEQAVAPTGEHDLVHLRSAADSRGFRDPDIRSRRQAASAHRRRPWLPAAPGTRGRACSPRRPALRPRRRSGSSPGPAGSRPAPSPPAPPPASQMWPLRRRCWRRRRPKATSAPAAATAPTARMNCIRIRGTPFHPVRPVRRRPRTGGDHAAVPLRHPPLLLTTPSAAQGCAPNGPPGRDSCPTSRSRPPTLQHSRRPVGAL